MGHGVGAGSGRFGSGSIAYRGISCGVSATAGTFLLVLGCCVRSGQAACCFCSYDTSDILPWDCCASRHGVSTGPTSQPRHKHARALCVELGMYMARGIASRPNDAGQRPPTVGR